MDKPGCETDMGMLLMLWVNANILPHLQLGALLFRPIVPKSAPGTAFYHEIADLGPDVPRLELPLKITALQIFGFSSVRFAPQPLAQVDDVLIFEFLQGIMTSNILS